LGLIPRCWNAKTRWEDQALATEDEWPAPEAIDLGWAWIERQTGQGWVLGASMDSPAHAWAVALSASDAHTVQELRAVERWREAGHVALVRASLELCDAWTEHGCQVGWRSYKGVAITRAQYARLTASDDGSPQRIKDQLN
jgi:hypothetical protein